MERKLNIRVPINILFPQVTSKKRYPYTAVIVKDKNRFTKEGFFDCTVEMLGLFTISRKYYPFIVIRGKKEYVERQTNKLLKSKYPNGELLQLSSDPHPIVKLVINNEEPKVNEKKENPSAKFMRAWLNKGK
jgi:hypothetical protein